MTYIKYTWKDDPTKWAVWAHEKSSKEETMIVNWAGNTYPYKKAIKLKFFKRYHKITYLTDEEVDLLKLELL